MANRKQLFDAIRQARVRLANPYAYLNGDGGFDATPRPPVKSSPRASDREDRGTAAERARELQVLVWRNRHRLWGDAVPQDPVEILEPEAAAQYLGIEIEVVPDVDAHSKHEHIPAGELNVRAKRIRVSSRASYVTRRFTIAHELGHLLLHDAVVMHRNRALQRTREEKEADSFAVLYLMPAKLVVERFRKQFDVNGSFVLNDETAYALSPSKYASIVQLCQSPRELARLLASTDTYQGARVVPLASQFGVSFDAMANRLLELELIKV